MPKGANLSRDLYHKNHDVAIFQLISTHNIANCVITQALDATQDEVCLVLTWSGAGTGTFSLQYQLPGNFQGFIGRTDDLNFFVKQTGDSGDGADVEVAVEVYDSSGSNISDGSLTSAVTSVAAFVERDCGITDPDGDGDVSGGDHITVEITIAGTIENNDILIMTIPKIRIRVIN